MPMCGQKSAVAAAVVTLLVAAMYHSPVDVASLRGKRVVLTGGSDGIGREVALQLARLGARVVICARNATKLNSVAEEARPGLVYALPADLSTAGGVEQFWNEAKSTLGVVDFLILNHVAGFFGDVLSKNPGNSIYPLLDRLLRVNTLAYAQLTMLALEEDSGTSASEGLGIVVVSSVGGKLGLPKIAPYAASKHALHGFFNSLRHDLVRRGSNAWIGTVVLGNIDTESNRVATSGQLSESLARYPAASAAEAVVQAAASRRRESVYPFWEVAPIVGLHPFFPSTLDAIIRAVSEP
eukprot:m.105739 g.105739  ORF g.105739 m.105739 type:complete len:296 (+) comp12661_c0_seq1:898-1785(+)